MRDDWSGMFMDGLQIPDQDADGNYSEPQADPTPPPAESTEQPEEDDDDGA